ncbi:hypothetical protein HHK36_011061 [Tetracentron sinense]|uniref:Uncharacterized protein n=1 Tax=Tetracentron sinense TaxID=13715 RepID=A0A834ZCU7_TETSI|nr:hypothetical protein HHK36_011061 [Tetracentron sinense]
MASGTSVGIANFSLVRQKIVLLCDKFGGGLCKSLAITGLVLYILHIFLSNHPCCQSSELFASLRHGWNSYTRNSSSIASTTNISHIVFGIAGYAKTWRYRRHYIDAWWRPNKTRGYLWLDRAPTEFLPWPSSSPPFRVSEDTSRFKEYKHGTPFVIRIVRVILETFREENKGVRWYVMADDDTVLFVDNLVEVLARYDHNEYFYIGEKSECVASNFDNSFEMAFGGAGFALSYPLAKAVGRNLDGCIKRYPYLHGSDHILQSCIADLGVSLTHERGFHQIDLHRDISGLLSAHPQVPLLSLHHLDVVEPIFPWMNRYESLNHLMEAAKVDPSRLLQQTICYHKQSNWSFSISWGYTAYIYEKIHPPSILEKPLQTFIPWRDTARPPYMFNTRPLSNNPCDAPHFFFFESLEKASETQVVTSYIRRWPRKLAACLSSGNHSADPISKIRVISPAKRLHGIGRRRECCDITSVSGMNVTEVRYRACMKDEAVALL